MSTNVYKLLGLDKIAKFIKIIQWNGGVITAAYKLGKNDDLKIGTLMGEDHFGNRYYENKEYFLGKNRWVEFAHHVGWRYDGSMITPDWYGWLHYKTDYLPHEDPDRPNYPWLLEAKEHMTGTSEAYMPYTTTVPKIEAWQPPRNKKNPVNL